jgi:hypothetical protein
VDISIVADLASKKSLKLRLKGNEDDSRAKMTPKQETMLVDLSASGLKYLLCYSTNRLLPITAQNQWTDWEKS